MRLTPNLFRILMYQRKSVCFRVEFLLMAVYQLIYDCLLRLYCLVYGGNPNLGFFLFVPSRVDQARFSTWHYSVLSVTFGTMALCDRWLAAVLFG